MTDAHVYVLERGSVVKIGLSRQPKVRARELGATLAHCTPMLTQAKRVERRAHEVMDEMGCRIKGEWFAVAAEQAIAAVRDAIVWAGDALPGDPQKSQRYVTMPLRVPERMMAELDAIRAERLDAPDRSTLIRKLLAQAIERERAHDR